MTKQDIRRYVRDSILYCKDHVSDGCSKQVESFLIELSPSILPQLSGYQDGTIIMEFDVYRKLPIELIIEFNKDGIRRFAIYKYETTADRSILDVGNAMHTSEYNFDELYEFLPKYMAMLALSEF